MAPRWPSGARNVTYVDNSKAVVPYEPPPRNTALGRIIDNSKALVPTTPVLPRVKQALVNYATTSDYGDVTVFNRNPVPPSFSKALVNYATTSDIGDVTVYNSGVSQADVSQAMSEAYRGSLRNAKAVVPWVAEKAVDATTSEQAWAISCGAGLLAGPLGFAFGGPPGGALVGAAAGATCLGNVVLKGKRGAEHVGNTTVNHALATATNFTSGLNQQLDDIKGGLLGLGERVVNQFAGIGNDIGSNVNEAIKAITAAVGSFFGGGGGGAGGAAQAVEGAANATRLLLTLAGAYIVYRALKGPSLTLK